MADARELIWSQQARRYGLHKCDVYAVQTLLKDLAERGECTPRAVRELARDPSCPVHHAKGWHWGDDKAAAEKYRLDVASHVITGVRTVTVTVVDGEEVKDTLPAFGQRDKRTVHAGGEDYGELSEIMRNPLDRAEYLTRLLRELHNLDRQYALVLAEFPGVSQRWRELRTAIEHEVSAPRA